MVCDARNCSSALVQSLIELSNGGSEERSLLESLSNHVQAKGQRFPIHKKN
jgi:hypothetical protein